MKIRAALIEKPGEEFHMEELELAPPKRDEVLVEFYPFEAINAAFADTKAGRVVKAVLRME